jgi:hypothetical protein
MKNLLIVGTLLLSMNSFAGNEKGNGGGVHYCENQTTQELYDIYEAQARFGYKLINNKLSVDGYIQYAVNKISNANPFIGKKVNEKLDYLKNNHMIMRPKVRLNPIGDANILITDEGCEYKQLANWDEISGNLIIKKEYYDLLDNLNKAAFHIHETLYKVGRDLDLLAKSSDGTSTSDEIRKMVGEIFSVSESLTLMWTIEDPQIEIDKRENREKTNSEAFQECSDLLGKTRELRNNLYANYTEETEKKYYGYHNYAIEICTQTQHYAKVSAQDPNRTRSERDRMLSIFSNLDIVIQNEIMDGDHFYKEYLKPARIKYKQ